MVKVKKIGKSLLEKRLFQFIIEKATNYTYVGLSSHRNVLGVENIDNEVKSLLFSCSS